MKKDLEPLGQYATDKIFFAGDPRLDVDPDGVLTRGDGNVAMHTEEVLFDGEIDEARNRKLARLGEVADFTSLEGASILPEGVALRKGRRFEDFEPNDAATAEWMAAQGQKW